MKPTEEEIEYAVIRAQQETHKQVSQAVEDVAIRLLSWSHYAHEINVEEVRNAILRTTLPRKEVC